MFHPNNAWMCPACGDANAHMRTESVDMSGKTAIVTGGRIKIGYEIVRKLLDAGCDRVIATTRFPADAVRRYERDGFDMRRLTVIGLDLMDTTATHRFVDWVHHNVDAIDVLINNAAQTIRRPPSFYRHLVDQRLEASKSIVCLHAQSDVAMCMIPKLPTDVFATPQEEKAVFPTGVLDVDEQQVDLRGENTWTSRLDEVSAIEMAETYLVNAMAPALFCARLKSKMAAPSCIVNVSAMEGSFSRTGKTVNHPHTNMAKAALNMLTRTSGPDYAQSQIYMTAVDTGWITNERPHPDLEKAMNPGLGCPIDCVDGAARVLHPVFHTMQGKEPPYYGVFLKDFEVCDW